VDAPGLPGETSEIRGADYCRARYGLDAVDFISQCDVSFTTRTEETTTPYIRAADHCRRPIFGSQGWHQTKCSRRDANILQTCADATHQLQRSLSLQSITAHSLWQKFTPPGRPPKIDLAQVTIPIRNGQFDILDSTAFSDRAAVLALLTEAAQTGLEIVDMPNAKCPTFLSF